MIKKYNKSKIYKKLTLSIIIVGIILRFFLASIYSVSGDACWQLSVARFLAENNRFPLYENLGRPEPFWAPPVFHLMAALLYKLFGVFGKDAAEFGMKTLSPLLGSLTLIFVYLINKKLFDERVTLYSMIFTTFVPIFIDFGSVSYIDGALTFFIILSVYFALHDRYIKSSIAAGLAATTKYNGIFIAPLLIYIIYKNTANTRLLLKKLIIMSLIALAIATPWFLRNYNEFGNPFWPFVNFLNRSPVKAELVSADKLTFKTFNPLNILSFNSISFTYLALFGVPEGNYKNFFFFDVPYIKILIAIWLLSTLFFLFPFLKGFSFKNKTTSRILVIWIFSYLIVLFMYISNVRWNATRFFLPAIPALGMIYGNGLSRLRFSNKNIKTIFFVLIIFTIIGFAVSELVKFRLAADQWDYYKPDFAWVKQSTNSEAIVIPGNQCMTYYLNRATLEPTLDNLKKADYIWVNLPFKLEKGDVVTDNILREVKNNNYEEVYDNKKTGTSIYKVKQ